MDTFSSYIKELKDYYSFKRDLLYCTQNFNVNNNVSLDNENDEDLS